MTSRRDIVSEGSDEIVIAFMDVAYDIGHGDEEYIEASLRYKTSLVDEFGIDLQRANIGPAADIPAFIAVLRENVLPLLPWLLAVFFAGKPIAENLSSWHQLYLRLRKFLSRPLVLSRNGAAILAIEAIVKEIGATPRSLQLRSYFPSSISDAEDFEKLTAQGLVEPSPPNIRLGVVFHIFEIEADGVGYLVGINGRDVFVRRL